MEKLYFKGKSIWQIKKNINNDKKLIHQEDAIILNFYVPNNLASKIYSIIRQN